MVCKYAHVADGFGNLVATIQFNKELLHPRRGNTCQLILLINAHAGFGNGYFRNVSCEYLDLYGSSLVAQIFLQAYRYGIGLFAGGAPGYPYPERLAAGFFIEQCRKNTLA